MSDDEGDYGDDDFEAEEEVEDRHAELGADQERVQEGEGAEDGQQAGEPRLRDGSGSEAGESAATTTSSDQQGQRHAAVDDMDKGSGIGTDGASDNDGASRGSAGQEGEGSGEDDECGGVEQWARRRRPRGRTRRTGKHKLMIANPCTLAYHGQIEQFQAGLADNSLDLLHRDRHGFTALHWAAHRNDTELVRLILAHYNRLEAAEAERLHEDAQDAGGFGLPPVAIVPEQRREVLNAADDLLGWTPAHVAAMQGSADVLELLWRGGASIDAQDKTGDRPVDCIDGAEDCVADVRALFIALRHEAETEAERE